MDLTVETFEDEIVEALRAFDKYIVCIDKTPEECRASLVSLMEKAIKTYVSRGPHLRHGIALDRQLTIILSQTDHERPLCGIRISNLHSPYKKEAAAPFQVPRKERSGRLGPHRHPGRKILHHDVCQRGVTA